MVRYGGLILVFLMGLGEGRGAPPSDPDTFFELKIRPILADRCFTCHGGKKVSHGLRVDSRAALLRGGKSGPAIVPGAPAQSLLIQAIQQTHDEFKMPPDQRLPAAVVADFVAWVQHGAPWPSYAATLKPTSGASRHWAFTPVQHVVPPPLPPGGSANPIDAFIGAKLQEHGLQPVPPADKTTLIRRVTFDLIGLPPTPEEVAAFLADETPTAFARVVDRLLASPHYGERWGRHWLDVARYADTAGDNADYPIPEIHLYRDYVIDAFNADKPYDQFVREQLAGDILARLGPPDQHANRVIATGFLALARRYATAPYELWELTMEDVIDTTGRTFLGLTLRCARCHDHKFDPVTQEDYYALYGIFASTQFPWTGAEEFASKHLPRAHLVPLVSAEEAARRLAPFQEKLQEIDAAIQCMEKEAPSPMRQARLTSLRNQRWAHVQAGLPAGLPAAYAVQDSKPVDMYVHLRGDVTQHGPIVPRNVPKFLAGGRPFAIPQGESGRRQLAQWLTRPEHPLTARVMVNRLWQHHFGKGLVATPSNFGVRGEPPTHPELLDWLAARFVAGGWSVKAMHRLMVLSNTYQRASSYDAGNAARDPGNRWYWRQERRRLDAESIRDALLMVSGRLDRQRPGPHPFPPVARWAWTQHQPFKESYPSNHRSVYLMTQRFQRHPYLALFDGPDPNTSTAQRGTTTVPQQALFWMNNPFVTEQAEGFARRLLAGTLESRERIDRAYAWAWSRPANAREVDRGLRFVDDYVRAWSAAGLPPERRELAAWTSYARILLAANEFVFLD